jgi:hypothetical protein
MMVWLISFLHFLVLLWAFVAPFTKELRASYLILMPVIMLHWIILDDACVLTLLESRIRGCTTNDSFVHQFISKIYNVPDGFLGLLMWMYALMTWLYVAMQITKEDFLRSIY